MKATYLGHQDGTDKKNREFRILYYSYSNGRIHGVGCDRAFLYKDSELGVGFPWKDITSGEVIELDFDSRGYLVGIDLFMPVK